ERAPDRCVEEDARLSTEPVGESGEVGDAGMSDDQPRLGIAVDDASEVVRDRRQAAAAVDQDRDVALGGQLEDRRQALVVEQELLGPRMQLDAFRAKVEAPRRLADRIL